MSGDVLSLSRVRNLHCLTNSKKTRSLQSESSDSFWPELHQVFAVFSIMYAASCRRATRRCSAWNRKLSEWTLRVNACSTNIGKHSCMRPLCQMFPKHWETCALNIEESSGTVYLLAASHKFQISSNNLTCHFMVRYFCETWKPQTPNT